MPAKGKGKRKRRVLANPKEEQQPEFELDTPALEVATVEDPQLTKAEVHREMSRDSEDNIIGGSQLVGSQPFFSQIEGSQPSQPVQRGKKPKMPSVDLNKEEELKLLGFSTTSAHPALRIL